MKFGSNPIDALRSTLQNYFLVSFGGEYQVYTNVTNKKIR